MTLFKIILALFLLIFFFLKNIRTFLNRALSLALSNSFLAEHYQVVWHPSWAPPSAGTWPTATRLPSQCTTTALPSPPVLFPSVGVLILSYMTQSFLGWLQNALSPAVAPFHAYWWAVGSERDKSPRTLLFVPVFTGLFLVWTQVFLFVLYICSSFLHAVTWTLMLS